MGIAGVAEDVKTQRFHDSGCCAWEWEDLCLPGFGPSDAVVAGNFVDDLGGSVIDVSGGCEPPDAWRPPRRLVG